MLEKLRSTLSIQLFLVVACMFMYSCHGPGGGGGGACHYEHQITGQSFALQSNATDEGDSERQYFSSEYCKDTLQPYWDTTLKALKDNHFHVEHVNLKDKNGEYFDYYKVSGSASQKQRYDEILENLTKKLDSSPRTKEGKNFCSKNLTPREDCPDCVNDLIYVGLVESVTVPCNGGVCANCVGNGCTLSFFSCNLGKVYGANSKGLYFYRSQTLDSILTCKDFVVQGDTLVFNQPVLSCLSTLESQDIFKALKLLCTEKTIPQIYTVQLPENGSEVDDEGNTTELTGHIKTEVWQRKKLTLKYPSGVGNDEREKYLRETVDDVLSLPILNGFECSFE